MASNKTAQNDEIDLFELCITLWQGKWVIIVLTALSVILSTLYLMLMPAQFEAKITIINDTAPPLQIADGLHKDFKKTLLQKSHFLQWRKANEAASFNFDLLSENDALDGFIVSKQEDAKDVVIRHKNDESNIIVRSNNLRLLSDFYDYANFTNDSLTALYLKRVENELSEFEARLADFSMLDEAVVQMSVKTIGFLDDVKNGAKLFQVKRPTLPVKKAPRSSLILALSLVLGGFLGAVIVLMRKAISSYRDQ
jgi:hypothetical protein